MSDHKSMDSLGTHDRNVPHSQQLESSLSSQSTSDIKAKFKEVEAILSKIIALEGVKSHIRNWEKRLIQDNKRKALGLEVGRRKPFHMFFLGNPGTGKTMVAQTLGKVLYLLGIISEDKVTEVQRNDLIDESIEETILQTRKKIQEASGGILFVGNVERLMSQKFPSYFGIEILNEIMAAMNREKMVVIFAGHNVHDIMKSYYVLSRFCEILYFDDYTPTDMANILHLKMNTEESLGFKLDSRCTVEAIAKLIEEHTVEEQRKKFNGGIVEHLLINSIEELDQRVDPDCNDTTIWVTITIEDLEAGIKSLNK